MVLNQLIQHQNGLSLVFPAEFRNIQTAEGFVLVESADIRSPRQISIKTLKSRPDELDSADIRQLNNQKVYYWITKLGDSSGGTEYELKAIKEAGDYWISLTELNQIQTDAIPDFKLGWQILENAEIK